MRLKNELFLIIKQFQYTITIYIFQFSFNLKKGQNVCHISITKRVCNLKMSRLKKYKHHEKGISGHG